MKEKIENFIRRQKDDVKDFCNVCKQKYKELLTELNIVYSGKVLRVRTEENPNEIDWYFIDKLELGEMSWTSLCTSFPEHEPVFKFTGKRFYTTDEQSICCSEDLILSISEFKNGTVIDNDVARYEISFIAKAFALKIENGEL